MKHNDVILIVREILLTRRSPLAEGRGILTKKNCNESFLFVRELTFTRKFPLARGGG